VAHHTEGSNPTEDVDAAAIDRKLVDLTGGDLVRWDPIWTVRVSCEMPMKRRLGKAHQKSADAIVSSGMKRPQLKGW